MAWIDFLYEVNLLTVGLDWIGLDWIGFDGMGWDGMGWDLIGWDGIGSEICVFCWKFKSLDLILISLLELIWTWFNVIYLRSHKQLFIADQIKKAKKKDKRVPDSKLIADARDLWRQTEKKVIFWQSNFLDIFVPIHEKHIESLFPVCKSIVFFIRNIQAFKNKLFFY